MLLGKSFVTMAMMAREIDPEFDLSPVAKSFALSLAADKLSPGRVAGNILREAWYIGHGLRRLPKDLRTLSRKLLDGSLQVTLHLREFERDDPRAGPRDEPARVQRGRHRHRGRIEHPAPRQNPPVHEQPAAVARRLFFAAYMPETSALGLGGFLFAGVLGMLLAVAIWRSGKL